MHAESHPDQDDSFDGPLIYQRSATETASEGVLEAVSTALDRPIVPDGGADPLPPLFDAIDPEAIDKLFDASSDRPEPTLSFTYCDCRVTIDAETITVEAA